MPSNAKMTSLKQQIVRFHVIGFCIALLISVIAVIMNLYTVNQYRTASYQYRYVSEFYDALNDANEQFKDYLYSDDEASYKEYHEKIIYARKQLDALDYNEYDDTWRIRLLQNMLNSYLEQVETTKKAFQTPGDSYEDNYTKLLDSYDLIKSTSDSYYELLTNQMAYHSSHLDFIKATVILLFVLFCVALLLWMMWFYRSAEKSILRPLTAILKNIGKIKTGTYDLTKISNTNSEIHALCEELDEMAKVVQKDIETTKENAELEKNLLEMENENLKKDELLAQSEVKMLQNQINPHFLFNTLNMTYRLALQENAVKCSEMIERTGALLRYGLDKQNKMSDMMSEIAAAENYIVIQEKRLGDRVSFDLSVDENIPNIAIPGMILQPLIENSLKHGLKNCEENGEIIISVRYMEPYLYIQISDNGEGMDSEKCEQMLLQGFHDEKEEHLGLYNVVRRLEAIYKNRVDINVESAVDCGFTFTMKIEVNE